MRKSVLAPLMALMLAGLPGGARADDAIDRLFDNTQMANVETGTTITFDHERRLTDGSNDVDIADGRITMTMGTADDGAQEITVAMRNGERNRQLQPFPGDAGNPVIMIFLESVTRVMAQTTGGSPFYIRNRIKDAFRRGTEATPETIDLDGETLEATRIRYEPFKGDKARDRMGPFADLELSFVVADAAPGHYLELSASSGEGGADGFIERIILEDTGAKP